MIHLSLLSIITFCSSFLFEFVCKGNTKRHKKQRKRKLFVGYYQNIMTFCKEIKEVNFLFATILCGFVVIL